MKKVQTLRIELPTEYHEPTQVCCNTPAVQFNNLRATYDFCEYIRMYITALADCQWDWRQVANELPKPSTMELINFPLYEYNALVKASFSTIKCLRLNPSIGQIYLGSAPLLTGPNTAHMWGMFWGNIDTALEISFPNLETLHVSGCWDGQYRYVEYPHDMSVWSMSTFRGEQFSRLTDITLEKLVIEQQQLRYLTLADANSRRINLRNCAIYAAEPYSNAFPEGNPWKDLFTRIAQVIAYLGYLTRHVKSLKVYGGPDGKQEGDASAFMYVSENELLNGVSSNPHIWKEARVQLEEGVLETYQKFQGFMADNKY